VNILRDGTRTQGATLWLVTLVSLFVLPLLAMHAGGESEHRIAGSSEVSLSQSIVDNPILPSASGSSSSVAEPCDSNCSSNMGDLLACMVVAVCAFVAALGLGLARASRRFWLSTRLVPPSGAGYRAGVILPSGPDLHVLSISRT
jgi:hypothetical protein